MELCILFIYIMSNENTSVNEYTLKKKCIADSYVKKKSWSFGFPYRMEFISNDFLSIYILFTICGQCDLIERPLNV